MTDQTTTHKNFLSRENSPYLLSLLALFAGYIYLTFTAPISASAAKYKLTLEQWNLVRLTFVIPIFFIWFVVFYAFSKIKKYAVAIKGTPDGEGFRLVGWGIGLFLVTMIVSNYISLLTSFAEGNMALQASYRLLSKYTSIGFNLTSYLFIFLGTSKFLELVKGKSTTTTTKRQNLAVYLITGIAAVVYGYLILNNPNRTVSSDPTVAPTFGVSDPLIFLTMYLPTVITWFLSLSSISNFMIYRKNVQGSIYKDLLKNFYTGFMLVMGLTIILQIITQFSAFWTNANISTLLIIIYILLAVILAGYVYMAIGSHKLEKMEVL